MKRFLFIIYIFTISISGICQNQTRLIKAKALLRSYIKNNINDYSSYSPISYSKVDSLFTSPEENENIRDAYKTAIESKEKAGLDNIDISVDISSMIEEFNKNPNDYDAEKVWYIKKYNLDRKCFYMLVDNFRKKFIGWKITHKYRAKNIYNATVLYSSEFMFNKDISKIMGTKCMNNEDNE